MNAEGSDKFSSFTNEPNQKRGNESKTNFDVIRHFNDINQVFNVFFCFFMSYRNLLFCMLTCGTFLC